MKHVGDLVVSFGRCPVTRYAVTGGCWLHSGRHRRGKPVYRFFAEA
jgi:hypothetical protein